MYYTSGNYEAFAHPRKPKDVDKKSAYLIGGGLASLAAACFLVRDGQMPGDHIHILEKSAEPGGALDGDQLPDVGYVMRGGREMDNHFECMWDLFHSIPSAEDPNVSILDEYYWLNKDDPNFSLCRVTKNRGEDAHTDNKFGLSDKGAMEIAKLFLTPDEDLEDVKMTDVFDDEVFKSNFWTYWRTMFAFKDDQSALEMKRYMTRFIHHIGGLPNLKALRFTKYNQYESIVVPMVNYLKDHGVHFEYDTTVEDVDFEFIDGRKTAKLLIMRQNGEQKVIPLTKDDLVFFTNGSNVENSTYGDQNKATGMDGQIHSDGSFALWERIAEKDPSFGHPEKFCMDPEDSNWVSATVNTLDDRIIPYIEKITKRDPLTGHVVTGGIVTAEDSNWLLSWTINRQPQYKNQPAGQVLVWLYGMFSDKPGDFINKPMRECTGKEICEEWLYHIGVPEDKIEELAETSAVTVPVMMPFASAYFQPRKAGDRPLVVPEGSTNFAFIGNFAETPRDTVFTTEYSIRTAMEAVYTLLDIERGVPEVWGSLYDVRDLLNATVELRDGKKITDMDLDLKGKIALHEALKAIKGTDIEKLLKEHKVI